MWPLLLAAGASVPAAAAPPPTVHVAYHGHVLTHPGIAGRLSWRDDRRFAVHPELESGAWVHPRNQVALFVRAGGALSHRGAKGGAHDLFLHVGGQRSTWLGPTFIADGDDIRRRPLAGQWWLTTTVGIGLGRQNWFVRPQVSWRGPYFHGLGTDVAIQIGTTFGGRS